MREVEVLGVRVSTETTGLVVYLQDVTSARMLSIAVGAREGAAIASALAGVVPSRPLTHDLALTLLGTLGHTLAAVEITHVADGVHYARILLDTAVSVDARPSDAIALAVRADVPIRCAESLLVPLDGEGADAEDGGESGEVARFAAFLDSVRPEDFGGSVGGQSHQ